MKRTRKLALASIFTALSVVCLSIGSFVQTLDLSASALASIIVLIAFIELGKKWAFGVYGAASILSLVLVPSKSAALVFAFFIGYYPIIKENLNRIKPKWLSAITRLICFNVFIAIAILLFSEILFIEDTLLLKLITYVLCNLTFVVFDFALERISVTYVVKIKPLFFGRG